MALSIADARLRAWRTAGSCSTSRPPSCSPTTTSASSTSACTRRGRPQVVPRRQALPAQEAVVAHDGARRCSSSSDVRLLASAASRRSTASASTVDPGELFAIIGPNGAGKTSIFNVLSGVYRPQAGPVELRRREHPRRAARTRSPRRGIARTFQNIALFEHLTVLDNLMLGRHHHIRYGALAAIAVARPGPARGDRAPAPRSRRSSTSSSSSSGARLPVGLLPYGVQKRVELGRALAMEPKLLLLDEPVAGHEPRGDRGHGPLHPRHPRRAATSR